MNTFTITLSTRAGASLVVACVLLLAACGAEETPEKKDTPPVDKAAPLLAVMGTTGPGYIVDGAGREVLLRGVNVNTYAEYWLYDDKLPAVLPFTADDHRFLRQTGYNFVRLLITWSRVEPQPGQYDDTYLAQIGEVIDALHAHGIYTLVDMHQDAWGPHIAAPKGTKCPDPQIPAGGWDGAPKWATLIDPKGLENAYCLPKIGGNYIREFVPVVKQAWAAMFANKVGPGGVGLQDRFAAMWTHVAQTLGGRPGVMGYDIVNEPNAMFDPKEFVALAELYKKAFAGIRAGETAAGIDPRIIVFEPGAIWAIVPEGATVASFTSDPQRAYGPHVYQGSIAPQPLDDDQVQRLRDEVKALGGVPVIVGEWGDSPGNATKDPTYFDAVMKYGDQEHWGLAHWVYQSACGDPHNYAHAFHDETKGVIDSWAYRVVDCATPTKAGKPHDAMIDLLKRPAIHFAPGKIGAMTWDKAKKRLEASGKGAKAGNELALFVPDNHSEAKVTATGFGEASVVSKDGARTWSAAASGGDWSLVVE